MRARYLFWGFLVVGIAIMITGWAVNIGRLRETAVPAVSPTPSLTPSPGPTPTPGWWMKLTPRIPTLQASGVSRVHGKPTPTPAPKPKCAEGVQIDAPSIIEVFWGDVLVLWGTADIPDLWYYKIEMSGGGEGWQVLYRSATPVRNGKLMEWFTSTVPPGTYRLRLVAVDKTGNYPSPCEITVKVREW